MRYKNERNYVRLDKMKCPRCEEDVTALPAMSRRNQQSICNDCGTAEALFDYSVIESNMRLKTAYNKWAASLSQLEKDIAEEREWAV